MKLQKSEEMELLRELPEAIMQGFRFAHNRGYTEYSIFALSKKSLTEKGLAMLRFYMKNGLVEDNGWAFVYTAKAFEHVDKANGRPEIDFAIELSIKAAETSDLPGLKKYYEHMKIHSWAKGNQEEYRKATEALKILRAL